MKLTGPTPETDALAYRRKDPSKAELENLCRRLERQRDIAVDALTSATNELDEIYHYYRDNELQMYDWSVELPIHVDIGKDALAQIKELQK